MSKFGGSIINDYMKRAFVGLLVMMFSIMGMAQQEYFIFIQETSRKPFYVRMGEESYSSSASGHIILSRLKDSVYNLYIGFPRSRAGEQLFTITMERKDHGYELRNFEGRWQLLDLRTQQSVLPVSSVQVSLQEKVRRTDPYSELMANVVDDTAVLYFSADTVTAPPSTYDSLVAASGGINDSVAAVSRGSDTTASKARRSTTTKKGKKKGKKDTAVAIANQPASTSDSVAVVPDTAVTDTTSVAKRDSTSLIDTAKANVDTSSVVGATADARDSTTSVRDKRDIIRLSTENVVEGKLVIYVDRSGPVNDTIRIIIPRL